MNSCIKKFVFCFTLLIMVGAAQNAFAVRFGLNTGFYNESLATDCFRSREFGLRLGFYADRTLNDLIYASAVRGVNICGNRPCGAPPPACSPPPACCAPAPVAPPCGCGAAPIAYEPAPAPMAVAPAPTTKTEIYLLVLPDNYKGGSGGGQQQMVVLPDRTYDQGTTERQVVHYPARPMEYGAPQGYYREPEVRNPVRGMW